MATKSGLVWAIDVGNFSLKALHLSFEDDVVEVVGFDNIRHGKILSGLGVTETERDELIALTLRRFMEQNEVGKEEIVISVPSQNSFARFVNIPPVDAKKIPEIVKFEAAQQIPFDINDVQWDYQLAENGEGSEMKVGIFAIKNEIVNNALEHFSREEIPVGYVQMVPMALHNYVLYDRDEFDNSENSAVVILDIGAENTDLVVCTKTMVWQRCIPTGGNAFTRAIADTFRLSFEKAEKLKRTAPMSKYARQVFQAMRPIYTNLSSEVQRSLGFYSNSNPSTKLTKVIAMGGGTRMRGLVKYLRQSLQMPVERPESFKKLRMASDVSTTKFHENVSDFGVVYGLALQGLGLAKIESNLLPRSVARSMIWRSKSKHFYAAALALLVISIMCLGRTFYDRASYASKSDSRLYTKRIINLADKAGSNLAKEKGKDEGYEKRIKKAFEPFAYRDVVPELCQTLLSVLPNEKNNSGQAQLYQAFANKEVDKVKKIDRKQRKQVFVTSMTVRFADDIENAKLAEIGLISGGSRKADEKDMYDDEDERERIMMMGGKRPKYEAKRIGRDDDAAAVDSGFVVTIAGYSPFGNLDDLLDPSGVENDPNRWGVLTRLMHLDDLVDGNSPFKLYKRTEPKHFELRTNDVIMEDSSEMPGGIGLVEVRFKQAKQVKPAFGGAANTGEKVLVDPMTKEIISRVAEYDQNGEKIIDAKGNFVYTVNDHWFTLKAKFLWKEAPKKKEDPSAGMPSRRR